MAMMQMQPWDDRERKVFVRLDAARRTKLGSSGSPLSYALAVTLMAQRTSREYMMRASEHAAAGDCATAMYDYGKAESQLHEAHGAMHAATRGKAGEKAFDKLFSCARSDDEREVCSDVLNQFSLRNYVNRHENEALRACRLRSMRRSFGTES